MAVRTTVVGTYPRVDDMPEGQRLRRAIGKWEQGDLTDEGLRAVEVSVIEEVVREQASLGVDVVTDGRVTWYDPQSHLAAKLEGVEIAGLLRYFDTNTYYRQPKVVGRVRWTRPITVDDWKVASSASSAPVKVVLTGPYTLAALSANGASDDLVMDFAAALGHEVAALADAGATHIQIDEPALTRRKELPTGYNHIAGLLLKGKGRAEATLFTYFGGVAPILEDLLMLPFDVFGFDLVEGRETLAAVADVGVDKPVALGLIDARNTKLEDPKAVAKEVLALADRLPLDRSYLSPSNGLEFLPRAKAREKLRILATAAKLVREGLP